jgi:hypothetical protein
MSWRGVLTQCDDSQVKICPERELLGSQNKHVLGAVHDMNTSGQFGIGLA